MKNFKKVLALVLAVVMLLSFATVASAVTSDYYKDAADIDYNEAVDVLGSIGVLNGFPDDTFRPDATITRAQAAKIIAMFDNGSTDINKLYTAANPFADCVDHWAESYIAYGVKTGIIAGIGGDKFAPEANVTGVQYLKMVLVVLGYDAKAEGLEGKNWDVNTLALAKRVGLTATLGNKFDYSADLARQEAAVIMLDALRADVVEYGSRLGSNGVVINEWPYVKSGTIYWTVTGAVSTGDKLMDAWKLAEGYAEDAFYRPYRTWNLNGKEIGRYPYAALAEYTTAYTGCDVLVDLGIAKTNLTAGRNIAALYINGWLRDTGIALNHTVETLNGGCHAKDFVSGAQGTLSQVFYVDKDVAEDNNTVAGYRITEIDTWLGKVIDAKKVTTNRDGHLSTYTEANIDVYGAETFRADNHSDFRDSCINETLRFTSDDGSLNEDDYVLVSYSCKTNALESVDVVEGVAGTLNGYKINNYPSQTRVDGTYIPDAVHFHVGYAASKDSANFGAHVFFYDAYGNVIGMVDTAAAAKEYLVIDKLWVDHKDGDAVLYADVVTLDAKVTEKVVVGAAYDLNGDKQTAKTFAALADREYAHNNSWWYDKLATYGVNSDGVYTIKLVTPQELAGPVVIQKGNAEVTSVEGNHLTFEFAINAATRFLVHEDDGSYTAYTGFRNVDSMTALHAQYIDANEDGVAEIVYLWDVIRAGSKVVAYVSGDPDTWKEVDENGNTLLKMTVYVKGVATDLYITNYNPLYPFEKGFYEFRYLTADTKNYVEVSKDNSALDLNKIFTVNGLNGEILKYSDVSSTYYTAIADDVTVYSIRIDGTVVVEKDQSYMTNMVVGSDVHLDFNAAGEVCEIYVIETIEY